MSHVLLLLAVLVAGDVEAILTAPDVVRAMHIVDENKDWSMKELITLTEIPAPPFGEDQRGAAMMERFRRLGLTHVWKDEEGNVYGERRGLGDGPTLVLSAHLDTVFPTETPIKIERKGTRLFAPGVGDNSVGLVTMLTVLKALQDAAVETEGTIIFMGSVGEEGTGDLRGVKHLFLESELRNRIDMFVSVDGTDDRNITNQALGSRRYRITYRGPGGHSWSAFGTPNPAFAMGRTLAKLADLKLPQDPRQTYNVGVVGGGTSINSIPYEIWMEIDLRGEKPEDLRAMEETFLGFVDQGVEEENRARTLTGPVEAEKKLVGDRPSGEIPIDSPIVETAVAVTRHVLATRNVQMVRSSTDSNIPISLGIPAITIGGGGDGMGAHSTSESFDPTHWERGIRRVLGIAVALVGLAEVSDQAGQKTGAD
ncbi:MAG: M20/M25/M40 family metallo-hydrolase [Vicinamibacteria bacterium]